MSEQLGTNLSRREALKRGALVGGAVVWAVPAVQALSMTAASAAVPSGGPGDTLSTTPPHEVTPSDTPTTSITTPGDTPTTSITTPGDTPTTPVTTTTAGTPTTPVTTTTAGTPTEIASPTPTVESTSTTRPTTDKTPTPGTSVEATSAAKPGKSNGSSPGGALPFTGGNIASIVEAGAAIVAVGAAVTVAARRGLRDEPVTDDSTGA